MPNKDKEIKFITKYIDYLIILFIILGSNSIFSVTSNQNYYVLELTALFLFLRIGLYFNAFKKIKVSICVTIFLWMFYIIMYAIISGGSIKNLLLKFGVLFILLILYFNILYETNTINNVLEKYGNIMLIIAAVSIFFWFFGSILHILTPTSRIPFYWGEDRFTNSYFGLYFEWQNDFKFLGRTIYRNIGIFTEGPMYSLNLSVAFLLDYFILKKRELWRTGLYFVTIISTVSITGIVLIIGSLVSEPFISDIRLLFTKKQLRFRLVIIIVAMGAVLIVTNRLITAKLSTASGSSRKEDYITGIKAWLLNPIFGAGYNQFDIRKQFMSSWRLARAENGFTNSPTAVLTEGGLYFFASYLISFINFVVLSFKNKNVNLFIFSMMWIYLFVTTTFQHTTLMVAFLAMSYLFIANEYQKKRVYIKMF